MPAPRIGRSQRRPRHRACRAPLCIQCPALLRQQRLPDLEPREEPGGGCNFSMKKSGHFSDECDSAWCIFNSYVVWKRTAPDYLVFFLKNEPSNSSPTFFTILPTLRRTCGASCCRRKRLIEL